MEVSYNPNPEVVVALNVGTTKVSAFAGKKNILGKIELLGFGTASCDGVQRGVVSNIDKTSKAICDAIDQAEKRSRQEITTVFVGIAGEHIKSLHHQSVVYRDNPKNEITQEDIEILIQNMHKIALPHGDKILHVVPQEFYIDNSKEGYLDPIGMAGSRLEGNFHIITANTEALDNLIRAVEKAQLHIAGFVLEPTATAEAVLSNDEKEAGVVLVDIGGGTTEVSIYADGIVRYTGVIPLGSNVITKDIKSGCSVIYEQAEKLKQRFGSAVADEIVDNRIITIPGLMGREPKEISEKNLARIIQSRVEELFEYIMWEIRRSGFENKILAGMVLTGGGAKLKDIELLAEFQTGLSTRIGNPLEYKIAHLDEGSLQTAYSTGLGILLESMKKVTPGLPEITEAKTQGHVFDVDDPGENETETVEVESAKGILGKIRNGVYHGFLDFFKPGADSYI
ncbi:MAG: cell division protein FtsA [Saprospiraceae bacterium]|nr:cell division protein FtsA [Saprospiraceae bacterium]